MELDDKICLCFDVSKRKVLNFLRVEKPLRPGQLSGCLGAGTGCGWCRPYLERLFYETKDEQSAVAEKWSADHYAQSRERYLQARNGNPELGR